MSELTNRELWQKIMHYEKVDRMPVFHWKGWPETYDRWYQEGLSEDADEHKFFNASPMHGWISLNIDPFPAFEEEVLEDTDDYHIYRQSDGVICKDLKHKSSIPHYIDFVLKDSSCWHEYERRLQPDMARIPADFDAQIEKALKLDAPISVNTGSMIGWIRNWMGVENLAYLCYDDRDTLAQMVDTISNLVCWALDIILPKVKVDCGWGWEDICFRTGPLISPEIFKEVAVPGYRKIADKLLEYGVDLYVVDCDGMIDHLVPHWLEAGVNVMFPVEIGVWQADPMAFRKKYGNELRIFGGIDKMAIPKGAKTIDAEITRRLPLMKAGGFIPLPDHLITPETSLSNYKYYLEKLRSLRF
ncbi:MAG TPA: uroporphyrinogen decarboxylase family protein [bacterium]